MGWQSIEAKISPQRIEDKLDALGETKGGPQSGYMKDPVVQPLNCDLAIATLADTI